MPQPSSIHAKPVIVTGQQIGAGWTPALSVVKALAALAEARRTGAEAVYWMADEDHDRAEVANTVGLQGGRLLRHRFYFDAPEGTATGWLPWGQSQQKASELLWSEVPNPATPTLRGHALRLGEPLWNLGLRPFSPTDNTVRDPIQEELERWRSLELETPLIRQAERLKAQGASLPLDPSQQAAWFSLEPVTGLRHRLAPSDRCPKAHWLSPGAAIRPLMQSLLLPVEAAILGPSERAYWRLTEPLWELVGLKAPRIVPRPSVVVLPKGCGLKGPQLGDLQRGAWEHFGDLTAELPSEGLGKIGPAPVWGMGIGHRFEKELARTKRRLERLDRRWRRDLAAERLGMDPERLRQALFPFGKPQERVLPGLFWLRDETLLQRILDAMEENANLILVEES